MAKQNTILVKSKSERFRRAGIEFTRAGVELGPKDLTEAQAEAIANEPMLIVVGAAEDLAPPVKTKKGK